jgi:hypothetical protein
MAIVTQQHGGSIEVDSQPGEFTEFRRTARPSGAPFCAILDVECELLHAKETACVLTSPHRKSRDRTGRNAMRAKTLAKLLAFSGAAICLASTPGLSDAGKCRHVGGGVLTNFLQPADCAGSFQNLCTDGTATGDLKGAVGVSILGITGNAYHVHHHWVTILASM